MTCSFPSPSSPSPDNGKRSGRGDDVTEQPTTMVLRVKAYPNVSVCPDHERRMVVLTLLPALVQSLRDAVAATTLQSEGEGLPALFLGERELVQLILYLQETLQEIRALPLLPPHHGGDGEGERSL